MFHQQRGEFTWPTTTQRAILDSFHWGYMLTQVPSGWLAQRFGGKRVFGFMMLTSSLSTVLVPVAARTHLFLLLSLRFIAGVGSVRRLLGRPAVRVRTARRFRFRF